MPQIGWLEILAVVIIAILVLGPKEFPIALKKIGSRMLGGVGLILMAAEFTWCMNG